MWKTKILGITVQFHLLEESPNPWRKESADLNTDSGIYNLYGTYLLKLLFGEGAAPTAPGYSPSP